MMTTESDESIGNFAHATFQQGLSLNKCALSFAENGERFDIKYLGEIEDGVVPESTQAINQVSVAVDRVKFGKFFADRMVNFLGKLKAS